MPTDSDKDKVVGKLREAKGAATGDTTEEAKGKLQGARGALKAKLGLIGKNGTEAGH
ncbi:MAG TPA: CsbD family protein [Chloroflexota bacterium]|nr:CsbD family protein [Chloroflexota bacterium]